MPIETEVKIEIDQPKKFEEIYRALENPIWSRQRNYIFLSQSGFLRIRYECSKAFLTVKGKELGGKFNNKQEAECEIPSEFFMEFSKILRAQKQLIYYEKSRASVKFMNCQICLDRFFGKEYIEIEGSEQDIAKVMQKFRLQKFTIEKRSYGQIYAEMFGEKTTEKVQ